MESVIAVFIPIIFFLVVGLVLVISIFYKSKEKQMLIEKGLSGEEIKKFFENKKDPFILLKIGIISIFFGLGLGFGMMLEKSRAGGGDYWVPLFLFTLTGLGFVVANLVGNMLRKKHDLETKDQ